jgi:alpha-1,2-mannosyltransferase
MNEPSPPTTPSLLNDRRLRYAWIAGAALWGAWLISLVFGPGNLDLAGQVVGTDYLEYYAAGLTLRLGESSRLYDMGYQVQLQRAIVGPQLRAYYGFITPPFLAWLFVPLSSLPYLWSFALWSVLSLLALWLGLRLLGITSPRHAALWALTWFPVFATVSYGQNSLLSFLLLSLVYRLWHRGHGWAAGLTASLLLYKPQLLSGVALLWLLEAVWPAPAADADRHNETPIAPLGESAPHRVYPIPLRRTSLVALLGLAIGGAVLAGVPFWRLPQASRAYVTFARTVLPNLPGYLQFPLWNLHTLWGFWRLLLPGQQAWAAALYGVGVVLGLAGFLFLWRGQRDRPALTFAAAICLTLWATPHAIIYDWTLLLIPAVLWWQHMPEQRAELRIIYVLIWIVAFVSGPLTFLQLRWLPFAVQISVPALLLAFYLVYRRLRQPDPVQGISS